MPEPQLYDSALKSLLGDEVAEILPNLLPGSQYVSEQNIEIDRTTLKADLVYNIMLLQAIKEMELKYKFPHLGHHLIRFRTVLRRSKTLSAQDKQIVEEHMQTYDSLLDSDPYLQQKVALERTLERNKALSEALQAFRDTVIEITKGRFPALTEIAQKRVVNIQAIESLQQLIVQLSIAPDQATARRLLQNSSVD